MGTGHPFCGEIAWVADRGLALGYGDGTFRGAETLTRQALAGLLHRALAQGVVSVIPPPPGG